MAESGLSQPLSMEFSGDVAGSWNKFRQRFELYLQTTDYALKGDKLKISLLLHIVGEEGICVYNISSYRGR